MAITAVVLMLTSRKAKVNGPVFVLGWLIGLGIVGAIVLVLGVAAGASKSSSPASWVSWAKIALGILLLYTAVRQFRRRPHGDDQAPMPKWMSTIDKTSPPAALGLGAVLSVANPKNMLLEVAGPQRSLRPASLAASRPSPTWSSRLSARSASASPWASTSPWAHARRSCSPC